MVFKFFLQIWLTFENNFCNKNCSFLHRISKYKTKSYHLITISCIVSKRIDDKTLEKFTRDVKSLRSIYTDAKIAMEMKTNPGNFSSRINGTKRPGKDFIDRFYQVWGMEVKEMMQAEGLAAEEMATYSTNDPKQDFPNYAIQILQEQDERLHRLEDSISQLNSSITFLMEKLLVSNQKLIDAHLSMLGQQAEKTSHQPAGK
jgi:hypothetical protein